jgi:RHS repeat-associated protein
MIDAKAQTTTASYDFRRRLVKRNENGLVSNWTYGSDPLSHNVGLLTVACTASCAGTDYQRTLIYDSHAREKSVTMTIGGTAATYTLTFDSMGRVSTVQYPSGLKVQYNYQGTYGYLTSITDTAAPNTAYWTATLRDADLNVQGESFGNGVTATRIYDPSSGRVQQIAATAPGGSPNGLANFSYAFDTNGNLTSRSDMLENGQGSYTENSCYDALNRLTDDAVGTLGGTSCASGTPSKHYAYDNLGNITQKSDLAGSTGSGTYTYPPSGASSVLPHAVTSIAGSVNGAISPNFSYDANGNLTCEYTGSGCTGSAVVASDTYTPFNKLQQITLAVGLARFTYDSEHSRITQHVETGTTTSDTTYLNDPATGAMSEKTSFGAITTWNDYLIADGRLVAERSQTSSTSVWHYLVTDHLGSVAVTTDSTAAVVGWSSYDPWGRMRNPDGTDDTTCSLPAAAPTTRGFTGQEEMPPSCQINFNARIYDPTIGRFTSADPMSGSVYDMQQLNRYSYVADNPQSATDPTGNIIVDGSGDNLEVVVALAPKRMDFTSYYNMPAWGFSSPTANPLLNQLLHWGLSPLARPQTAQGGGTSDDGVGGLPGSFGALDALASGADAAMNSDATASDATARAEGSSWVDYSTNPPTEYSVVTAKRSCNEYCGGAEPMTAAAAKNKGNWPPRFPATNNYPNGNDPRYPWHPRWDSGAPLYHSPESNYEWSDDHGAHWHASGTQGWGYYGPPNDNGNPANYDFRQKPPPQADPSIPVS